MSDINDVITFNNKTFTVGDVVKFTYQKPNGDVNDYTVFIENVKIDTDPEFSFFGGHKFGDGEDATDFVVEDFDRSNYRNFRVDQVLKVDEVITHID